MPTIRTSDTPPFGLISMRLLISMGVLVIIASMALMTLHPTKMMPHAKAAESTSDAAVKTSPSQKSWSDEWYETQKAIPAHVGEEAPTF
jgi:hypothetical protein